MFSNIADDIFCFFPQNWKNDQSVIVDSSGGDAVKISLVDVINFLEHSRHNRDMANCVELKKQA